MPQNTTPNLKLVGTGDGEVARRWRSHGQARDAVASENRRAAVAATSDLDPTDPRWVLAARTKARLQGPILTPERRERLQRLGHQLGLSRFDTSVVIATVQDQARQGHCDTQLVSALTTITKPAQKAHSIWARRWGAAIACAIMATWLLVWWLLGSMTGS